MRRISIIQGEHAVVTEPDTVISTVLGSCIAVCLRDGVARIGGMNHFLLGEPDPGHHISVQDRQRYGLHAMELLINALMGRGAVRSRLTAQLYGGGNVVAGLGTIGQSNADFARRFLQTENIPLIHADVGGTHARRVEFLPVEGKARSTAVTDAPPPVMRPAPVPAASGDLELF
ncbi:chemotaxis protein CheD [Sphingomonas sp. ac-8]|uniref:chemotaxis protein CheD n=1 Tax=Sphingomonas sp. ac-8 TaxID=3242977 RepID=UPI003A812078